MDRLNRNGRAPSAAEAFAGLRIGGALVVALAVLLGPQGYDPGFLVALAAAAVYSIVLAVLAALGLRGQPRVALSLADIAFILLLIALSGEAQSEARLALVVYPVAMGLAHTARAIAAVSLVACAGFVAVSLPSLGSPAADSAFVHTVAAIVIVAAIGVALSSAFQRHTSQIEELAAGRTALLHEALDAEERERARIGERLHDDTLQSLIAAQQDVREARAGYLASLEYADEALTDSVQALRETVLGLHPTSLDERGLELALRVELDRVARRTQLEVDLHVDADSGSSHDALLYAVARELITNVVKHASARRLEVSLERVDEAIVLTVTDDGIGIAPERPQAALATGHVGLTSTRRRIDAAGGRLELLSAPGTGTRIRATVPVRVVQRTAVAGTEDDPARIGALRGTGLVDGDEHPGFVRLARLAARLLDAPIAFVSLIDAEREFLAAQAGVPEPFATRREWPLTHSFGRHVVAAAAPLVIDDARADPVLRDSRAIAELGMVAYAGVPLITAAGYAVGTLSVADRRARPWSEEALETLHELAQIARGEIALAERATRIGRGGDEVESERRFIAAVLENLGEGVMACDELGELRIVNAAARRHGVGEPLALGDLADRGELHRAQSGERVGRRDLPLHRALQGESVAGEEYLVGDPAAPHRSLLLAGQPIAGADAPRGAIMTIRDVTEQRLAQRTSREAEERFRVAFDHAPNGMAIAGLDGRFWSANLALVQLTGLRPEALRHATLESLLHPDDIEDGAEGLRSVADGTIPLSVSDKRVLHADGHEVWVSLQVAVIRDGAGRPRHLLVQLQDTTERRREEERLRTLSDRDPLTLMLNRSGFLRELGRHAARLDRYGIEGGVLLIDVDGLRRINDALGRGGGDDVLRRFAAALEARVRRSDVAARVGEDEFAVLAPHGEEPSLLALADALLVRLRSTQVAAMSGRTGMNVTVSIGVAAFGAGATEADTVLLRAQAALQAAKLAGGDRTLLFGPGVVGPTTTTLHG